MLVYDFIVSTSTSSVIYILSPISHWYLSSVLGGYVVKGICDKYYILLLCKAALQIRVAQVAHPIIALIGGGIELRADR